MLNRAQDPRRVWLAFYLVVNVLCAFIIYKTNRLLGETSDVRLQDLSSIAPATAIVVLTFVVILAVLFPMLSRVVVRACAKPTPRQDKIVGVALFALQLAFIAFFMSTGTFVAGSTERSDSIFSTLWVLISVDSLFFVYYGFYRDSRLFGPNLVIAVVSNVLRGWTGIFILIAFMESARLMRQGKFSTKLVLSIALVFVLAYPVLNLVKLQIRFMSSGVAQDTSLLEFAASTATDLGPADYVDLIQDSATQLLARIHLVSNTIVVNQDAALLSGSIRSGEVVPFWKEGIYGLAYDRLAAVAPKPNLGVALATAIDPSQEEGSWNSNPGYASWLILDPASALPYIAYTVGLMFLCVVMVKRLGGQPAALDMLWFACLSYVIPGWIASFVLFFNTLIVFYVFHLLTRGSDIQAAPRPGLPSPESPAVG